MAERVALVDALHEAIESNDKKAVGELLRKAAGLSAAAVNALSSSGYTALYHACMRKCDLPLVQLLLSGGAVVDLKGDDKETPLYIATHNELVAVVATLIAAGAQVNELNGVDGETALHASARFGFADVADALVNAGANVNMRNVRMETPLFVAAKFGKHELVYKLLACDANKNLANEDGKNPLFIASERGHKHVVQLLKVEKTQLRDAKAVADVEVKLQPRPLPTTDQLIERAARSSGEPNAENPSKSHKKADAPTKPTQPMAPLPITKIEIPENVVRTHDPLTGKAYGPCKTLEQVGRSEPPEIPKGLKIAPLSDERYGGTSMKVGTGTGMKLSTPPLLSQLPDADVVDFGSAIVLPKKK